METAHISSSPQICGDEVFTVEKGGQGRDLHVAGGSVVYWLCFFVMLEKV